MGVDIGRREKMNARAIILGLVLPLAACGGSSPPADEDVPAYPLLPQIKTNSAAADLAGTPREIPTAMGALEACCSQKN